MILPLIKWFQSILMVKRLVTATSVPLARCPSSCLCGTKTQYCRWRFESWSGCGHPVRAVGHNGYQLEYQG